MCLSRIYRSEFIVGHCVIVVGDDGSGDETDVEDNVMESNVPVLFPSQRQVRTGDPDLPETVEVLTTRKGCKVYLVGTAHFSENSQQDVIKVCV